MRSIFLPRIAYCIKSAIYFFCAIFIFQNKTFAQCTNDVTPPVITPLSSNIKIVLGPSGTKTISLPDVATITDNCNPSPTYTLSATTFSCIQKGMNTITINATDGVFGSNPNPSAATFYGPIDVARDIEGNLYVLELFAIRKISTTGTVSTLVSFSNGYQDGPAGTAKFRQPRSVAADGQGNVYVGDWGNHVIRKITANGTVSTYAGTGVAGYADGPVSSAQFNGPWGIAFDTDGNLWVSDAENHRIRKITTSGLVLTVTGTGNNISADGTLSTASYNYPVDVAFDAVGNTYIDEMRGGKIRKIDVNGNVISLAGNGYGYAEGTGTAAQFANPTAIVAGNDGNIYVADNSNSRVRKVTPAGVVSTLYLTTNDITGITKSGTGSLIIPNNNFIKEIKLNGTVSIIAGTGVAGSTNGNIGVPASGNQSSLQLTVNVVDESAPVITPVSTYITLPLNANGTRTITLADVAAVTDNCTSTPAVTFSPSTFTCSNAGQQIVTVTATDGTFAGVRTPGNATFFTPYEMGYDAAGNLYIAETQNYRIRKISVNGDVTTLAGSDTRGYTDGPGNIATFSAPRGLVVDAAGNIIVSDVTNHVIRKITPQGVVSTFAGGVQGYLDGTGTAAQFNFPQGLAIDPSGNIYVADAFRIRKITPQGVVTTFAGNGTSTVSDGIGTAAGIPGAKDLECDNAGNIYFTEMDKIRMITPAGVVTTIAGSTNGFEDGPVATAKFGGTWGLTVAANGDIYVADASNRAIRKISNGIVSTIESNSGYPYTVRFTPTGSLYYTTGSLIREVVGNGFSRIIAGIDDVYGAENGNIGVQANGNQTTVQIPVNITGQSTPVFTTTQANISQNAVACSIVLANYAVNSAATSSCGGAVTISQSPVEGTILPVGVNTITLKVTDASGNFATQNFTVTVIKVAPPTITPYQNVVIALGPNGTKAITHADVATVSDCGHSPLAIISPTSFNCSDIGTKTVTVTATDGIINAPNPSAAKFNSPVGVAVDPSGNIYVADRDNRKIRKITTSGNVSTFADGASTAQGFNGTFSVVSDIASDLSGNIYLTDAVGAKIKKITPAGVVTTLAGNGTSGSQDGTGTSATFTKLDAITVSNQGIIYVADNDVIRRITPAGVVTTLAGGAIGFADGTGTAAKFWGISGLATDSDGNIYVADGANYKVRKVTPAGVVTTVAGTGPNGFADGPAASAMFSFLHAIVVDADKNIFVTDSDNDRIRKISAGGIVSSFAGGGPVDGADGNSTTASFALMTGMAMDANRNLIIAEITTHKIRKADPSGNVTTLAGSGTAGYLDGNVSGITGNQISLQVQVTVSDVTAPVITPISNNIVLALDATGHKTIAAADLVTVSDNCKANPLISISQSSFDCADAGIKTITVKATDGTFGGTPNPAAVSFNSALGTAADAQGNIYVADHNTIRKITASGIVTTLAGDGSNNSIDGVGTAASFNQLHAITVDGAGNIYTAEFGSRKIRKVTPAGVVTTLAGSGDFGSLDGSGTAARFGVIYSVAADQQGNVYVAETSHNKIRKVTPAGVVTTYAGTGNSGFTDGPASTATFTSPVSVAVDINGNVYVGEQFRIRKITAAGVVSTFVGGSVAGNVEGAGTNAVIARPMGIITDPSGNLFATQEGEGRIIKVTPAANVTVFAGHYGETTINGTGTAATFRSPEGIAIDAGGNVYVADWYLNNIRKITPAAVVSTLAGSGAVGSQNGNVGGGGTGNESSLQLQVTVKDVTAPVITPVSNNIIVLLGADGTKTVSATDLVTVMDNCNTAPPVEISKKTFSCIDIGVQTIIIRSTDGVFATTNNVASGNESILQLQVIVKDVTPPVLTCPANILTPSTTINPSQTGYATASDNCPAGLVITYSDNSNTSQACKITRTWKATDASGNFSTCIQTITIPQMSVNLGPNMFILYGALGYVGCHTISPTVTGGVGPYTYKWTSTDALVNNATSSSVSPCQTTELTYTYTLLVTSANGCTATASVQLAFINISCSKNANNEKVELCLKPNGNTCQTVCVSVNAAATLINNGAYYGKCLLNCEIPVQGRTMMITSPEVKPLQDFNVKVQNNPTLTLFVLTVTSSSMEKITVRFTDAAGKLLELKENILPGELFSLGNQFAAGIYFAEVRQGKHLKMIKLVKQ